MCELVVSAGGGAVGVDGCGYAWVGEVEVGGGAVDVDYGGMKAVSYADGEGSEWRDADDVVVVSGASGPAAGGWRGVEFAECL